MVELRIRLPKPCFRTREKSPTMQRVFSYFTRFRFLLSCLRGTYISYMYLDLRTSWRQIDRFIVQKRNQIEILIQKVPLSNQHVELQTVCKKVLLSWIG